MAVVYDSQELELLLGKWLDTLAPYTDRKNRRYSGADASFLETISVLLMRGRQDKVYYLLKILESILPDSEHESVDAERMRKEYARQSEERMKLLNDPDYIKLIGEDRAAAMKEHKFDIEGVEILELARRFAFNLGFDYKLYNKLKADYEKLYDNDYIFNKEKIQILANKWERNIPSVLRTQWENECDDLMLSDRQDKIYYAIRILNAALQKTENSNGKSAIERVREEYEKQSKERLAQAKNSEKYAKFINNEPRARLMDIHNFDIEGLEVLELACRFAPSSKELYQDLRKFHIEQVELQNRVIRPQHGSYIDKNWYLSDGITSVDRDCLEYLENLKKCEKIKECLPRTKRVEFMEYYKDVQEKFLTQINSTNDSESAYEKTISAYKDFVVVCGYITLGSEQIRSLTKTGKLNKDQEKMILDVCDEGMIRAFLSAGMISLPKIYTRPIVSSTPNKNNKITNNNSKNESGSGKKPGRGFVGKVKNTAKGVIDKLTPIG